MIDVDALDALPAVALGPATVLVDRTRPVAALLEADGSVGVLVWPDAPLPARAASPTVLGAPGCVWVVYSESSELSTSPAATAVRLGRDGGVTTCELGALAVIGADSTGVWLAPDPYLAMAGGGADDAGEVVDGPPAGFEHTGVESWEDFQRAEHAWQAERVRSLTARFPVDGPRGVAAGEEFGWFVHAPLSGSSEPLPAPPAPVPSGPVTLTRVRAGGGRDQVVASRAVSRVLVDRDGALRLVFHPTGPVLTPDEHGGWSVRYPRRVAEVDVTAGLPSSVDLDATPSLSLADEEEEANTSPVAEWGPVDLSGVAGTRWTPRPLEQQEATAAVEAVRAQYAALAEPRVVWTRRDDRWHRVQSEYAEVHTRVEGEWPSTEVVVDLRLRSVPGRSFRRRRRVFDPTGAPYDRPYVAAHLEEDLFTADLGRLPLDEGRLLI